MNRGRRREDIFLSRQDYQAFIQVLRETADAWNLKVAAYCLMPNHYHLLVHTPDGNISRCMRHLNGVYTQRFNRHHKKDGQLFRGRYKAVLVEADSYLLEVLRYIHKNPQRAGITDTLRDFEWSSHHGYLSQAEKWDWLHKDFLLSMLTARKSGRRAAYTDFVSGDAPEEIERFYSQKNLPSILGSAMFKEKMGNKFAQLRFQREVPASRELAPTPEKIIDLTCAHFRVRKNELLRSRRGTENLPRDIAIWLVRQKCRKTLAETGSHFAIEKYSTVSSAIERIKARKIHDRQLRHHLQALEKMISKSQKGT